MSDPTPQTAELVLAGGEHVPGMLREVEAVLGREAASWGEPVGPHGEQTISAGGKRLRPLLLLLVAGPPAGPQESARLENAAAAIELIHSATLVHDDVLDNADLRRGRPTVYAQAGPAMATSAGDLLFARAFTLLTSTDDLFSVRELSEACSALARGELMQREDAWNKAVSVERYLERCRLKTAALFEAACAIGADVAGLEVQPMRDFGRRIGLAFQVLDDVLDVSGPPERTGKPRGTDLLDGTVTLPLILALQSDARLGEIDLRSLEGPERAGRLCDRIEATGALELARESALAMVAEATEELPEGLGEDRRRALELVAEGVVARYS
ncbi:MAG: polyprenyl synthetase family protein [Solirubrobacteraceae bacterium]|nr:polyprenyl synthetase family protein [Solirubrobacteraceae bacterium]